MIRVVGVELARHQGPRQRVDLALVVLVVVAGDLDHRQVPLVADRLRQGVRRSRQLTRRWAHAVGRSRGHGDREQAQESENPGGETSAAATDARLHHGRAPSGESAGGGARAGTIGCGPKRRGGAGAWREISVTRDGRSEDSARNIQ